MYCIGIEQEVFLIFSWNVKEKVLHSCLNGSLEVDKFHALKCSVFTGRKKVVMVDFRVNWAERQFISHSFCSETSTYKPASLQMTIKSDCRIIIDHLTVGFWLGLPVTDLKYNVGDKNTGMSMKQIVTIISSF